MSSQTQSDAPSGAPLDPRDPLVKIAGPEVAWFLGPWSRRTRDIVAGIATVVSLPWSLGFPIAGCLMLPRETLTGLAFLLCGAVPIVGLGAYWRRSIAHRILGTAEIALDPPGVVELGTVLRFHLDVAPGAVDRIKEIRCVLIEKEGTYDRRASRRHRRAWRWQEHSRSDVSVKLVTEADGARVVGETRIARTRHPTAASDGYRYDYVLHLDVEMSRLPDARFEQRVALVRPEPGTERPSIAAATAPLAPLKTEATRDACPRDATALGPITGTHERDCARCRGVLISADGLARLVLEPLRIDPATVRELLRSMSTPATFGCPTCGGRMLSLSLRSVPVEMCTMCGSTWLDGGERDKLTAQVGLNPSSPA